MECLYCKSEFEPRRLNQIYCRKKCKDRASYKRTGGMARAYRRRDWKRKGIHITVDQYCQMSTTQSHRCLICDTYASGSLVVDHNHTSGNVRGLLCNTCNLGLGSFRDNQTYLQKAIDYLNITEPSTAPTAPNSAPVTERIYWPVLARPGPGPV